MKTQVRNGLFETNSSSTHCIVIGNNGQDIYANLPKKVTFEVGCFGWEHEVYNDIPSRASYLYTAMTYIDDDVKEILLDNIQKTLRKWDIECVFEPIEGSYYIDHGSELEYWINSVVLDEDILMNFLFSENSFVETGNDNSDEDYVDIEYTSCCLPTHILHQFEKGN